MPSDSPNAARIGREEIYLLKTKSIISSIDGKVLLILFLRQMLKPLRRPTSGELKKATIGNSITVAIGDVVQPGATTNAGVVVQATTGIVLGVVVGIEQNGKISELASVATASDNQTTNKYVAVYIPAWIPMEYEADLSAAAGTTTGSNLMGSFNLVSATTGGNLDETSYLVFSGTAQQFFSYGVQSYSTTKVRGHFNYQKVS